MSHAVTLIPGDGTGPEITEATRRVLEATGVQFIWEVHQAGLEVLEKCGTVLPDEVIESIKRTKVALKGPITTPIGKGSRSANVLLRKKLDLYANLRPAKTYHGLRSRYENIDLTIVRENTEDLYSGIEFEDRIVDNMCMQLVQKPEMYDMLVLPNLYGDIISDLSAGLIGGLGVAPGANIGSQYAIFEPVHGSAPKYAGQNKVNPMAMMFSGVLMLRHLCERDAANRLEKAIAQVIAEGKNVTYDLKPRPDDPSAVGTSQVADAVIEKLLKLP